ncbi:hypothetical protein BJV78DRAFT_1223765 [Lactifluus subvellereus]|nr:hypothetical protein BJV78DRAFT_1223765 [Lactifluus subvellereus]
MPLEVTRALGNVARRIANPDACPAVTGELREFTVAFMWHSDKSYCTWLLVGDPIRSQPECARSFMELVPTEDLPPCRLASKWPDHLSIEPAWHAMQQDKFQGPGWLREHKPVPVRLQAGPETEKHEYDQVLKWLRDNERVGHQCSRQTTLSHLDSRQLRAGGR